MSLKVNKKEKAPIKSIWDNVDNRNKDFFFNFLEKKVRAQNKKLKEIERLEQQDIQLRPEQLEKLNAKEDVLNKISEYENTAKLWLEALKEKKQEPPVELRLLIEALVTNNETVLKLLEEPDINLNTLTNNLYKTLLLFPEPREDLPYPGLAVQKLNIETVKNDEVQQNIIQEPLETQLPKEENVVKVQGLIIEVQELFNLSLNQVNQPEPILEKKEELQQQSIQEPHQQLIEPQQTLQEQTEPQRYQEKGNYTQKQPQNFKKSQHKNYDNYKYSRQDNYSNYRPDPLLGEYEQNNRSNVQKPYRKTYN